ncbi:hypothetical protein CVD28_04175 [Bacillus sp. M6-12]|uniref:metallophosphoesterase family protein n=1 Tax=Bacillus sp. M6-12 TaxID=2054166 RepID=UPI000C76504C|nr:metallophosphoesterase [Bacillus sp. M6-12]PLS19622.1 hypothetical protein CVD28_04175 [Bacillus sp. M6-12]
MKVFSVADIHGNMRIYKQIVEIVKQQEVDVLILPGDLYPKPDNVTFETYKAIQEGSASDISALLKELSIPIYYVLGNDDWVDTGILCGENLHGRIVEYQGIHFTGFEYVKNSPFHTNRELSEDNLKKKFKEQVQRLDLNNKEPLIIVGHTPLFEKQDKVMGGKCVGSRKLRMEVEKLNPLIYLCGHIHEAFGENQLNDTYIFNCACAYEVDLLRGYLIEVKDGEVSYEAVIR